MNEYGYFLKKKKNICTRFLATSCRQVGCMEKCSVDSANFIYVKMIVHSVNESLVEMLSP